MALSKELQLGKAGEHLVCCDLIKKGYNAFLTDQGLPYDIIVEHNKKIYRVQVKTTTNLIDVPKSPKIYRFQTRRAKGNRARFEIDEVDYFAFAVLETMKVAYLSIADMIAPQGCIKQTVDFKTKAVKYSGRIYNNGTVREPNWGKYFEDYGDFIIGV